MATVGIQQAYATTAESDTYLALKTDWIDADDDVKADALLWGRYYIDANFDCEIDADDIPDEAKLSNSLLGYDYFTQGDLFFDNQSNIILKRVKAGSVESETEYSKGVTTKPNSHSKVVAIMAPICNTTYGSLVRV